MKRYYITFAIAAVVVALDQFSKKLVMDSLPLWKSVPVINGFFNLVHVRNRGAAFGFLNRSDIEWQFWLFAAFTVAAVILVLYMVRGLKPVTLWGLSAFGAILGGAAGNFIDRVRFRHVVDFLDFYVGGWHWPAFNVADIALCYGIAVFAFITLFPAKPEKAKQN